MNIKIFDVDHGFCAAVETDEGHNILIDGGSSIRSGFRPEKYLLNELSRHLDYLIVPAYTETHLSAFLDLVNHFSENNYTIEHLIANPLINAESLDQISMRHFGNHIVLRLLNRMCRDFVNPVQTLQLAGAKLSFFWNEHPDSLKLHDVCLVTFLSYRDINIIFPADLEVDGWKALLEKSEFRDCLRQVNIFVAAGHGHKEGYCSEVFEYCHPDLVIVSTDDSEPSHQSLLQYESHAKGLQTLWGEQKLIATRQAGSISIEQSSNGLLEVISRQPRVYRVPV